MAEDFKFHYTYAATGELSGESFVRQTEDGIKGIGKYAKKALDVAARSRDLSTETLERVRKTESNASNSIEIAKQALTNVETCTLTLDKWRPIVSEASDVSHQAIAVARSADKTSAEAVETANASKAKSISAEKAALDSQAKAAQASVSSERSSEAAQEALDALRDAKKKIDESAHAAEVAGVKCVRYVGQTLTEGEKQVARDNIEAIHGTPEGAFIPSVESPKDSGKEGQIRFNANGKKFEGYDGSKWSGIGGDLVDESNNMKLPAKTAVYAGENLAFNITKQGIQQSGTPSNGSDVINKSYLDKMLAEMKEQLQNEIKDSGIPTSTIAFFAMNTVPTGWLLCNGAAVSRTKYADLFKAIGTTYGKGDGSTTFNLPNMNERFAEGTTDPKSVGKYVEAGLPNITGLADNDDGYGTFASASGALYVRNRQPRGFGDGRGQGYHIGFDASIANSTYGASQTVQPSSIQLFACVKA